jgi:hypothetical protein
MNQLTLIGLVVGLGLTMGAWLLAARTGRLQRAVTLHGLRNGLLAALVLGLGVTTLITLTMFGRPFLFGGELSLGGALMLGLLAGTALAVGFFYVGATLLPIGLLLGGGARWASVGSWVLAPVVAVGLYAGYLFSGNLLADIEAPEQRRGTIDLELNGEQLGRVQASGAAHCLLPDDGSLSVDAGLDGELTSTTGDEVWVQLTLDVELDASVVINVAHWSAAPGKGWEPNPDTLSVAEGSRREWGQLELRDLVPLNPATGEPDPTERWSGLLSWDCLPR